MVSKKNNFHSSEEWEIRNKIRLLNNSYYIFIYNYIELKSKFVEMNKPENIVRFWDVTKLEEHYKFRHEIIRLLHNYLAAAMSLKDHTNLYAKELYFEIDFFQEYKAQIQERFTDIPVAKFVQDLRNYIIHKGLPFSMSSFHYDRKSGTHITVNLELEKLKDWDNWTNSSKTYLNSLSEDFSIETFIREYVFIVSDFHNWFNCRQLVINMDIFKEKETFEELEKQRGLFQLR